MRRLLALAVTLCACFASPASAATPEPADITGLGEGKLQVSATAGSDVATVYLTVLSASSDAVPIEITYQASDAQSPKVEILTYSPRVVETGPTRVGVKLGGLSDLEETETGQLVVLGGAAPVARELSVKPPPPDDDWPKAILWGSVGVFVFFYLVMAINAGRALGKPAPGPKWALDSWATTLTAAGGLLAVVIGDLTLPDPQEYIDSDALTQLNLLFAGVVIVATFLFQALWRPKADPTDQEGAYPGWNATLLLALALTFAAVLGEIGTFALLLAEVAPNAFGFAVLVVLGGPAIWYFLRTTPKIVKTDWVAVDEAAEAKAKAEEQKIVVVVRHEGRRALRRAQPSSESVSLPVAPASRQHQRWKLP